jgi:hypothetical protein
MRHGRYVLGLDGEPLACDDLAVWAAWFETANRHVGKTEIGDVEISTVFLGLDHNWGLGPPVLWETMIFGGALDNYQERYTSRAAAIAGHAAAVARVRGWPQ